MVKFSVSPDCEIMSTQVLLSIRLLSTASVPGKKALDALLLPRPSSLGRESREGERRCDRGGQREIKSRGYRG